MSGSSLVDTIIQGAAVDLLHSLEIAAAPLPPTSARELKEEPEFSAFVQFSASSCNGTLYMGCPASVIQLTKRDTSNLVPQEDWIRELTNQLMGRVKKRFLQFSVTLHTTLPAPAGARFLMRHNNAAATGRVYAFRTLYGTVLVLLVGDIDHSRLVYSGGVCPRDDGDIILF